jgi:hypothetical protein
MIVKIGKGVRIVRGAVLKGEVGDRLVLLKLHNCLKDSKSRRSWLLLI